MRTALAWMAVGILGAAACRSDGPPRAAGARGADAAETRDAVAAAINTDSSVASDGQDAASGSDGPAPDGSEADAGGVAIDGPDAAAVDASDGPAVPAGPRPVKASPGCGKGNRAEGIQYVNSGGHRMLVTVRLPAGYDTDRPTPAGVAFPDAAYPQCTVWCLGFTDLDAITLFPSARTVAWEKTEEDRRINTLFFEDVIAFVKNEYCVDENRMFVAGAGAGGQFAQQLACKHGDWLWQVTPISAREPHSDPACRGTPAALVIQSVQDNGADVAQAVVANFAARNGCSATPPAALPEAREAMLAAHRADRPDQRCLDWAGCSSPVRLCLVSNRVYAPGDGTQGYRGWPRNGGALIGEFLDRLFMLGH